MRWFSFLAKLTFICNLMFLVAVALRFNGAELPQWITGTVLVLGWFLSVILNVVFIICLLFVLLTGKRSYVPVFLTILNILITAFQFYYFLSND
jgi:hypothetical protein